MNLSLYTPILLLLSSTLLSATTSFTVLSLHHRTPATKDRARRSPISEDRLSGAERSSTTTTTRLNLLLDVPDQFFTFTFPMLGILLGISKSYARVALEEAAWEKRLAEAREARLAQDPTLTELDLRRQEAAHEWSAYGVPRLQQQQQQEESAARGQQQQQKDVFFGQGRKQRRVSVLDRDDEEDDDADALDSNGYDPRDFRMTEEEIAAFELEYGIEYDAYYDEPYAANELPEGEYDVDRLYGDRIYKKTGEIFYRDAATGLFWRQGSKPRNLKFFKFK